MICSRCSLSGSPVNFPRFKTPKGEIRYRSYCKSCEKDRKDNWRKANKDKHNARSIIWVKNNKEKRLEIVSKYLSKNRESLNEKARLKKKTPLEKAKTNAYTSLRRKRIRQNTPAWVGRQERKIIFNKYLMCSNLTEVTGVPHHVDHIVPLNGKIVCGLNVPSNLRVISAEINLKKSRGFI